ncbi:MAG: hypothetical protein ABIG93_03250 [archaeon]|nr:hypothetical protein [Nanoarchaeota archaeon]
MSNEVFSGYTSLDDALKKAANGSRVRIYFESGTGDRTDKVIRAVEELHKMGVSFRLCTENSRKEFSYDPEHNRPGESEGTYEKLGQAGGGVVSPQEIGKIVVYSK